MIEPAFSSIELLFRAVQLNILKMGGEVGGVFLIALPANNVSCPIHTCTREYILNIALHCVD